MIDDVSSESGVDNAEIPPTNVLYRGVQYVGNNQLMEKQFSML